MGVNDHHHCGEHSRTPRALFGVGYASHVKSKDIAVGKDVSNSRKRMDGATATVSVDSGHASSEVGPMRLPPYRRLRQCALSIV